MDHRSFASTRLARKPGCLEATPGEPTGFTGMWLEPHRSDEPVRVAQWTGRLWGPDSGNFLHGSGVLGWRGRSVMCPATFVWASHLLGVEVAGIDSHARY